MLTIGLGGTACSPRNVSESVDAKYKLLIDKMFFSPKTFFVWAGQYLLIFETRNKILMDFFLRYE